MNLEVFVHKADVLTEEYKIGPSRAFLDLPPSYLLNLEFLCGSIQRTSGTSSNGCFPNWHTSTLSTSKSRSTFSSRLSTTTPSTMPSHAYYTSSSTRCHTSRTYSMSSARWVIFLRSKSNRSQLWSRIRKRRRRFCSTPIRDCMSRRTHPPSIRQPTTSVTTTCRLSTLLGHYTSASFIILPPPGLHKA